MSWKDETTYSKGGDKGIPRIWVLYAGNLRIVVHRHRDFGNDTWLLSAKPFFNKKILEDENIEKAKNEAKGLVFRNLQECLKAL